GAQPRPARCLAAALLVLLSMQTPAAEPEALPPPRAPVASRALDHLVHYLAGSHPVERLRFAAVALDELARAYTDELDAAARDPRPAEDAANLARWRAAARATIAQLRATAAELASAPDVRVFVDPGATLRFVLDGRTVLVDTPRVSGPDTLNERIARRYCERAECPQRLLPATATDAPRVWTSWSFGGGEPALLETSIGLDFRFADMRDMGTRKRRGRELVSALERSARLLAWHLERGLVVEWSLLHLAPAPAGDGSALVVNATGDWLAVPLAWRAVPQEPLARWYRARVAGRTYRYVFNNGESLLQPAPAAGGGAG
ncbi:MAG: hypothetical protein RLW42_01015, partial [Gammaproteobacteria bacterium]